VKAKIEEAMRTHGQ